MLWRRNSRAGTKGGPICAVEGRSDALPLLTMRPSSTWMCSLVLPKTSSSSTMLDRSAGRRAAERFLGGLFSASASSEASSSEEGGVDEGLRALPPAPQALRASQGAASWHPGATDSRRVRSTSPTLRTWRSTRPMISAWVMTFVSEGPSLVLVSTGSSPWSPPVRATSSSHVITPSPWPSPSTAASSPSSSPPNSLPHGVLSPSDPAALVLSHGDAERSRSQPSGVASPSSAAAATPETTTPSSPPISSPSPGDPAPPPGSPISSSSMAPSASPQTPSPSPPPSSSSANR
mmetsp:Transcript_4863/g.12444  ORF Transcript_4863/g.12444 Transcript_4863/m.12444 type:complete len:291 (+) Transcript_4863:298-1170(+)